MKPPRPKFKFPQIGLTILVAFVLLVGNSTSALHSALNIQISPLFQTLFSIAIASALTIWVHYDSRSTKVSMGLDQALYLFVAWPVTFPIYIFRSYGLRSGSLILLSFLGIYALTMILAMFLIVTVILGKFILSAG